MRLEDLKQAIPGLSKKSHADKIIIFGWYLHSQKGMAHFQPADVKKCYDELHLDRPQSFSGYFSNLLGKGLLKNASGYRLENSVREKFDAQYGNREITVQVTHLLSSLPEKIPDLAEQTFLKEALICYRHGAFRAAIVMTWNLAYHHFCDYILKKHLPAFNARWPLVYQGHHTKKQKTITNMDDFAEELKESQVIEICNSAGIITSDVHKILTEKLGTRNSAAHPSSVNIGQLQAEEFIDNLIKNVVLKLT